MQVRLCNRPRVPSCFAVRVKRVLRRSLWLLDRVFCPRCLKMTEDGPKMAPRWPQAGLKVTQHGSSDGLGGGFQSMTSHKNEQLAINTCEHNVDIGFKPL